MTGFPPWLVRRPLLADCLLAGSLVLLEAVFVLVSPREVWPRPLVGALAASVLCAAPVALRRRAPRTALVMTVGTLALPVLADLVPTTQSFSIVVLTYTMAADRSVRFAVASALLLWVPVAVINGVLPIAETLPISRAALLLNNLLVGVVAFSVGRTVHARRVSITALRERARVAEENQRALAEQAVADERRRIARELHDVVAHNVSVMGVLATGARRVLPRAPDAADEALATIGQTSRSTLRELRRLLDVLRTDTEPDADLAPQPGLAAIGPLVEQVREAGLPVTLRMDDDLPPVDPGIALTVYRIVQEALANALRHAGQATVEVWLRFADDEILLTVEDTGRGAGPAPTRLGHGLVGMRERVALYGGSLRTGPRPGGGFRVHARIPVERPGASAA